MSQKAFDLYGWNYAARPERAEALSPGKALKKVPNFKCRAYF